MTIALDTPAETRSSSRAWLSNTPSSDFAIRAEGLTRTFGTIRAVDNLTLQVPRGIVFGFLGPNGSGKTTTIRLLLGLLESSSGLAEVLGFDTRFQAAEIRARSGALLEDSGIYDRLSAEANLDFYARVWHLSSADRHARIREMLVRFDLWERRAESPELWSTGMRQKLAVARALLHRPALMFLDEPTSGLDPIAARQLGDDLAALASTEGVTVFLTTHDLVEAERLCQRVAVVRAGRLLATGTPADIRTRAAATATILGSGFDASALQFLRLQPEVAELELSGDRLRIELRDGAHLAPLVTLLASTRWSADRRGTPLDGDPRRCVRVAGSL